MLTILGNDKNHAHTRLNITDLETGRRRKKICYTLEELEFERSNYSGEKYHVEEWRYELCTHEKMAL